MLNFVPNEDQILHDIEELKKEHRSLDDVIAGCGGDQLKIQRLKREKLLIKDRISKLEGMLHPDIIA